MNALFLGLIILLEALLSALHCHLLPVGHFDYGIDSAPNAICVLTFAVAIFQHFPKNKPALLGRILLLPLLFALAISWAELLSELQPGPSKGWGVLWFMVTYESSFIGLCMALAVKWLVSKCREQSRTYFGNADNNEDQIIKPGDG